ncbi:mitotic-spindle organizing protein 2A [Trichonephila clavipes]|nr:mitotic-spindle organizing protein 2A [Trichonephila clavipes]
MVVNVTMKREMSFICPQDVKNSGGILFYFREDSLRKCFPLCGICWQKFMARLQFVRVFVASRALLVPEAASDAIASISTAMQGARASFKHGRPARARSSNFPVSSKRLTNFKRPAGIERGTNRCFFRVVERRTKEELLCVIKEWVLPGSTIVSDCWKAYKCLPDEGFKHLEVNHSVCFKDPDTGAHTNSVEGTWSAIKRFLRNHTSHAEGMFDHYLTEYLWRRSRDHSLSDETFQNFLKAVVTLYPPLGKDQQ